MANDIPHDKAGPCAACGCSINHAIHAPPYDGREVEIISSSADGLGTIPVAVHAWIVKSSVTDEQQRTILAADLVQCLKMWDCTREDAADILKRARRLVKKADTWANPLKGTGFVPLAGSGGLKQQ